MKILLKNLGLIMMLIGAVILIGVFLSGGDSVNSNLVLGGTGLLIVLGLIVYIVMNKRITD